MSARLSPPWRLSGRELTRNRRLQESGTVTSSRNPRQTPVSRPLRFRLGGAVEIYCSGLGATLPPADGLKRTRIIPQVEIGGRDAEVRFSGLAPGLFRVLDAPTGAAVEVRLRAGGAVSNTVTMGLSGDPI